MKKIRAGIIGVTGYAGAEIARLLHAHPDAEVVWYGSRSYAGQKVTDIFPQFLGSTDASLLEEDWEKMAAETDVIFTATPQGYCAETVKKEYLSRVKVIDLSADFRFRDAAVYEQWYGMKHPQPELLLKAVYGLCEINREEIRKADLIANPGCYTTCAILSCYPALSEKLIDPDTLIVDAMSGVSGAGRGAKVQNLFCEVQESAKPYGVTTHRHTPEIEEQLSIAAKKQITLTFTPHLVPMNRGILSTCYATLEKGVSEDQIREVYRQYYEKERFIRLLPQGVFPETRFVEHTNLLDIQLAVDSRTNRLIITGALDNLVKGAAGQAVQNMNILFGLDEGRGLL